MSRLTTTNPATTATTGLSLDSTNLHLTALTSLSTQTPPTKTQLPSLPLSSAFPLSKHIPKTRFLVDFFRFPPSLDVSGVAFFLSHFHSDHYSGISPTWSKGIIFCSNLTARLLIDVLQVPPQFVYSLPMRETVEIDGCEVTIVDANHCPGAVQFLFKVPLKTGGFERYVHTGDFRYCESMKLDDLLSNFVGCDAVYLDTTYCNPKFVFPSQQESVEYVASVVERIGGEFSESNKSALFLVATYVIGKEKILIEVAKRCKRKIYVNARKMSVLRVMGYGESNVFTENESDTDVHVVAWNVLGETWPYFRPNFAKMKEIMAEKGYDKVIGFVPTGWTYELKRSKFSVRSKDSFDIHLVPYSEHSNYDELREYVKFLKPKKVVPTVGMDIEKVDSKHASKMQKHFTGLVDEMANKKEFLRGFSRGSCRNNEKDAIDDGGSHNEELGLGQLEKSLETKAVEDNDNSCAFNDASLPQEPSAQSSVVIENEEETEKFMLELRDCLPTWVTRDQILQLINCSGRNIVDVVTNFYEREIEFYQQIPVDTSSASASASQLSLLDKAVENVHLSSVKSPQESISFHLQSSKSLDRYATMKSSISPGKRKKTTDNKPKKKVKSTQKLEAMGPKQSTITKFFNRTLASGSHPKSDCTLDESQTSSSTNLLYKEEIDMFLGIVNGDESLRISAAAILEKAEGDINRALDLYYCNPEVNRGENVGRLVGPGQSIQSQYCTNSCSSLQEKHTAEKPGQVIDLSTELTAKAKVDATLLSLPPDKYNPVEHACWSNGEPAPYIHIARAFDLVEGKKGKIRATAILCNMFRSLLALSPEDVLPTVYLCTNKVGADHENIELNIGGSLVTSAMEEACGTKRSKIKDLYKELGDLGDVALECRRTQKVLAPRSPLLIKNVFSTLQKISVQTGSGSTTRKKNLVLNLLHSCREKEIKFIVRTLVRNLRIGAMMRTVLPAVAQAVVMNSSISSEGNSQTLKEQIQSLSAAVVEAYNILPNLDLVVPSLMENSTSFSPSTLSMVPGVPIKPMLAKITNGVPQALKLFQNKAFTCEYKYDGQRAQIHKLLDGTIRVFSRNGDETTSKFPDLINTITRFCKPGSITFILDAEVVAVDRKNDCKLMSFQELSSRGRGSKDSSVTIDSIKVDICVFVFDVMFANGEQLLGLPLRKRRKYLMDLFLEEKLGHFEYAKEISVEVNEPDDETLTKVSAFLEDAFQSSCEGIMVKSLDVDAGYSPSKRTDTWLKVKRDYVDGLGDSLDLVPIGAWHGNGRKAGWYSPFLMACYNSETEEFQSVCRVMSGISDSFYKEMKEFYSGDKILMKKPSYYRTAEEPSMWFAPELVWEIKGADFTVSPVHHAAIGLVHPSRGISIRFPRLIRSLTDRNPEDCSTAEDVADMFHAQTRKMNVTS